MYRSTLFIITVALAAACGGRQSPGTREPLSTPGSTVDIDRRAERLTVRGRWGDARRLLERGIADARARGDRAGLARLLLRRGRTITDETRHRGGDRAPALADLEAARREAEAVGAPEIVAGSIDALATVRFVGWFASHDAADLTAAAEMFSQALVLRAGLTDLAGLAGSHFHVGLVHQMRGEREAATEQFSQALAVAERADDAVWISEATRHLAYMAELRRDLPAAEALYARSLALREKAGGGPGGAAAMVTLAELRYARDGDPDRALDLLGRAHRRAVETGSAAYTAISSAAIARVHRDLGHYDEALRRLGDAIRASDAIHSDEEVPESYEQIALVDLLRDQPAAAVTAAERGIARRPSPRLEALLAVARARTGQRVAAAAAQAGDAEDAVVTARLALAAGSSGLALDAAMRGDDPDTLLLAAHAVGRQGLDRATPVVAAMSRAQQLRFERERAGLDLGR